MAQKTTFATSERASLFFGDSGDLSEHFSVEKVQVQISSQNFHIFPGLYLGVRVGESVMYLSPHLLPGCTSTGYTGIVYHGERYNVTVKQGTVGLVVKGVVKVQWEGSCSP